jgi:hypothetical protein
VEHGGEDAERWCNPVGNILRRPPYIRPQEKRGVGWGDPPLIGGCR